MDRKLTQSSLRAPLLPPNLPICALRRLHACALPKLVGILNVTPDSFHDGGRYVGEKAWERFQELAGQGADIIDIGAESSRPGSEKISADEELSRLAPLFQKLSNPLPTTHYPLPLISIDSTKSQVARAAIGVGASVINDISGCRYDSEGMISVLQEFPETKFILMHMKGDPKTMQANPSYSDVVGDISDYFEERLRFFEKQGIKRSRIILDPGIGFGKKLEHNLEILRNLAEFKKRFSLPLLIGASRKSFIGMILDGVGPEDRLEGSLAAALWCGQEGVDFLRVHDVAATKRALKLWHALMP